ncbi:hypothetical protein I3843_03G080300 [Carya illinoinensis]|nr:hypothetical protein I3843_03G080300 [Carya illinoinensis]
MNKLALYVSFLHLIFAHAVAQDSPPPYIAPDYILLNCGSSSTNSTSPDGRNWEGDSHSKFSPHNTQTTSTASTATEQIPSVAQVPYMTARIFPNNFTYSFPVSSGLKFVRLYFYPATYGAVDKSKSFFSVTANDFTLLRNFSAYLTMLKLEPPAAVVVKEFIIPVLRTQCLNITFISLNSYAFINGIEVVSIPNNLYMDNKHGTGIKLNVGGKDVSGVDDTGMFRRWADDLPYVLIDNFGMTPYDLPNVTIQYTTETPSYTAPEIVYKTFRSMGRNVTANLNSNLTWNFTQAMYENDRVFKIFNNSQTAEVNADVILWSGSQGIPVYKDYIVFTPNGNQRKIDLLLALHPCVVSKPLLLDALLNGVEIFKLNRSDGSFGGVNLDGLVVPKSPEGNITLRERKRITPRIMAVIIVIAVSVIILGFISFRMSKRAKKLGSRKLVGDSNCSPLPSHLCRHFSFAEIKAATKNFDDGLIIGVGGFGNVYKGYVEDGSCSTVAIKRLKSGSQQGAHEFTTEISTLSKLRHRHIVSLIGYCDEDREMILVYEYMNCGTLRDHLYGTDNPPLTWKRRLDICIGAALGLEYLHTGTNHLIIHRDVKTTNILLNENWVAKVSDFVLCKIGPTSVSITHISTAAKGSFGYLDPEYFKLQQLTEKSDVYSFSVVLCKVLCARPPLVRTALKKQVNLAEWFRECYHEDKLDEIVDPFLKNGIKPECLKKFVEVTMSCLLHDRSKRPSMRDVVGGLQFALQLQGSSCDSPNIPSSMIEMLAISNS